MSSNDIRQSKSETIHIDGARQCFAIELNRDNSIALIGGNLKIKVGTGHYGGSGRGDGAACIGIHDNGPIILGCRSTQLNVIKIEKKLGRCHIIVNHNILSVSGKIDFEILPRSLKCLHGFGLPLEI